MIKRLAAAMMVVPTLCRACFLRQHRSLQPTWIYCPRLRLPFQPFGRLHINSVQEWRMKRVKRKQAPINICTAVGNDHITETDAAIPSYDKHQPCGHNQLVENVETALRMKCNVRPGQHIIVAVSGGVDSVALLHLLHWCSSRFQPPLNLSVAHFNHKLRQEADEEETFITQVAKSLNLPIRAFRWTSKDLPQMPGIQERSRQWRRQLCLKILEELGGEHIAVIATAHHSDDQVETFFLKLLRGVHLSRLRGMEYRSGPFIKPLLGVSKEQLFDFMKEMGLEWREDCSNQEEKYKRNKVRIKLLPLLRELAGGKDALSQRVEEMGEQSRGLEGWLQSEVMALSAEVLRKRGKLSLGDWWQRAPDLVRDRVVYEWVRLACPEVSYEQVRRIVEYVESRGTQWELWLSSEWIVRRVGAVLELCSVVEREKGLGEAVYCAEGQVWVQSERRWDVEVSRVMEDQSVVQWPLVLCNVPYGARLQVRKRRDGDRFCPGGCGRERKLKQFLRDQHVALEDRDDVPVLVLLGEEAVKHVVGVYPDTVGRGYELNKGRWPRLGVRVVDTGIRGTRHIAESL